MLLLYFHNTECPYQFDKRRKTEQDYFDLLVNWQKIAYTIRNNIMNIVSVSHL